MNNDAAQPHNGPSPLATCHSPLLEAVAAAVRAVGREEVMPRYLKVAHERKMDGSLLTEADVAAQHALIQALTAIAPHPVLGEEMTEAEQRQSWDQGREGVWCVDPIDGTTNFVSGLPFFAISVALVRNGRTEIGVVYNPQDDELFCAEAGGGAFLNDDRLPIKPPSKSLHRSIAGVDFKRLPKPLAIRLAAEHPYSSQRNLGASTLDWCYLAAGRLHLYLHGSQKLWDYAAGWRILTEAGGAVCTLNEDEFWQGNLWNRSVVAALNPELLDSWKEWVRRDQ